MFYSSEGERVPVQSRQGLFARCVRVCNGHTYMVTRESELFSGGALSPLSAAVYCVVSRAWENRLLSLTELFYSGWGIGHSNRVLRMPLEGCREHASTRLSRALCGGVVLSRELSSSLAGDSACRYYQYCSRWLAPPGSDLAPTGSIEFSLFLVSEWNPYRANRSRVRESCSSRVPPISVCGVCAWWQ